MIELPKEACLNPDDVAAVISNEAHEGHEGIFLATHTPIRDFEVTGSQAGEIDGRDEQAVLFALSDLSRSHAFCVFQGEPERTIVVLGKILSVCVELGGLIISKKTIIT